MATNTKMSFTGKWTLTDSTGKYVSLKDSKGSLEMTSVAQPGTNQYFNTYGDLTKALWIQAGNWNYFTFSGGVYVATESRGTNNSSFVLEPVTGDQYRILENTTDGKAYYINIVGTSVERILKTGNPPSSTIFNKTEITEGLSTIKSMGTASGLDLEGVYLSDEDLKNISFLSCKLSHANFSGSKTVLSGITFQGSTIDYTSYENCDLDNVIFSGVNGTGSIFNGVQLSNSTNFNGAVFSKMQFKNATNIINNPSIGDGPIMNSLVATESVFSGSNLSGAALSTGTFTKSQFINVSLNYAQIVGSHFDSAIMSFTNMYNAAVQTSNFTKAIMASVDFEKSTINQCVFNQASLINAKMSKANGYTSMDISDANMTGAILTNMDLRSVIMTKGTNYTKTQMSGVNLDGHTLDDTNFMAANLENAILTNTSFNNAILVGTDMSNAVFRKGTSKFISFLGANLSNASLLGANLTGAQFNAASNVGTVSHDAIEGLNSKAISSEVMSLLNVKSGLNTFPKRLAVTVRVPGQEWLIEHDHHNYLVNKSQDGLDVLKLGSSATAAVMTNVFMPNAILTGANLYAVNMSGVNWYGAAGRADNANMEQVNLTNANLSTLNLTQAKMYGADLSFAKLINTDLTKVALSPTSASRPASLSFTSLQGAIFTQSSLQGADLTNAAISLGVDSNTGVVYGIPMFKISDASVVSITTALNSLVISDDLVSAFTNQGVTVVKTDPVGTVTFANQWLIKPAASGSYVQYIMSYNSQKGEIQVYGFVDKTSTNPKKEKIAFSTFVGVPLFQIENTTTKKVISDLNAATLFNAVSSVFSEDGYTLIDSAEIVVVEKDNRWIINNKNSDPNAIQSGYGQFIITKQTLANSLDYLQVYGGTPFLVTRSASGNQLTNAAVTFGATTKFTATIMDNDTTCPSGLKFELLDNGVDYEQLMTPGLPPHPPKCIPSPTHWC